MKVTNNKTIRERREFGIEVSRARGASRQVSATARLSCAEFWRALGSFAFLMAISLTYAVRLSTLLSQVKILAQELALGVLSGSRAPEVRALLGERWTASGSRRGRLLRVARTIADLAADRSVGPPAMAEALRYRDGLVFGK